ncbi:MAG: carbohydrate-binding protein [Bacillota bacterium]
MLWQRRQAPGTDMEIASETTPAARSPKGKGTRTSGTRSGTGRATQKDTYLTGGVSVSPMPITAGEEVTVKYNGLLAEAGADSMYLHAGFGAAGAWHSVLDIPMSQEKPGVWRATIPLDPGETSRLNFCFKDRASNWDNNYGLNWSFDIHNG